MNAVCGASDRARWAKEMITPSKDRRDPGLPAVAQFAEVDGVPADDGRLDLVLPLRDRLTGSQSRR